MITPKIQELITSLIGQAITMIFIDGQQFEPPITSFQIGEEITLGFASGANLNIRTDDHPHFLYDGNLSFEFENSSLDSPISANTERVTENTEWTIEKISLLEWKPKGILSGHQVLQVNFSFSEETQLSIGFFREEIAPDNFIATGELAVNPDFNQELKGQLRMKWT